MAPFSGTHRVKAPHSACWVMHPCRFGPKRAALTFDPDVGLQPTVVQLRSSGKSHAPLSNTVECRWADDEGVPVVLAAWKSGVFRVEERFFCPDRTSSTLARTVTVWNTGSTQIDVVVATGSAADRLERSASMEPGGTFRCALEYRLSEADDQPIVSAAWLDARPALGGARAYWSGLSTCTFDSPSLNHLFAAARWELPAVLGPSGQMDGSIWQYNLEWCARPGGRRECAAHAGGFRTGPGHSWPAC